MNDEAGYGAEDKPPGEGDDKSIHVQLVGGCVQSQCCSGTEDSKPSANQRHGLDWVRWCYELWSASKRARCGQLMARALRPHLGV